MKRSQINLAYRRACASFARHHWTLPPRPAWDITDFGRGNFDRLGLTLVNLAHEPEYCEKLMYARRGQLTPCHMHRIKKEDIICRVGELALRLWPAKPGTARAMAPLKVAVNRRLRAVRAGRLLRLKAGSRVTLRPGVWHEFYPVSRECIIGEVSTANDDAQDNFFLDPAIGRFPGIEENAKPLVRLISE